MYRLYPLLVFLVSGFAVLSMTSQVPFDNAAGYFKSAVVLLVVLGLGSLIAVAALLFDR